MVLEASSTAPWYSRPPRVHAHARSRAALLLAAMPALLEPPSHACRDAVVRRHVDQAAASALATSWLADLSERVSSLLDDATYADGACDYDRAQRRCRNRRNVEAMQPAGHRRFSFLTPLPICGRNNSALGVLGHPDLDGHKLVCGLATLAKASRRRPAVVFSLGSNNNFVFEQAVVRRLGRNASVHTFDCTVDTPRVPPEIRRNVVFHQTCIGERDEDVPVDAQAPARGRRAFRTWAAVLRELQAAGHAVDRPDLMKVDIEGHERSWLWRLLAAPSRRLPRQILIELHYNTLTEVARTYAASYGRRLVSAGELAMLAQLWHTRGYRLVAREDNPQGRMATELTLLLVEGC